MKKVIFLICVNVLLVQAQWNTVWSSSAINYSFASGFFAFQKTGTTWKYRLYAVDTLKFQVMQAGLSTTPQYTYTFNSYEKLAGEQLYSTGIDLNGDGITEFYVLGYVGTSTAYRVTFKVFDIVTGNTLYYKDDGLYSFSYPSFSDLNGDGIYEMTYTKYLYPSLATYNYEVVNTGVSTGSSPQIKPVGFSVNQNYPNPFNPSTTISVTLEQSSPVRIEIFDIQGELIRTLSSSELSAGRHDIVWNGKDDAGASKPSGTYFYNVTAGTTQATRKMLLLK